MIDFANAPQWPRIVLGESEAHYAVPVGLAHPTIAGGILLSVDKDIPPILMEAVSLRPKVLTMPGSQTYFVFSPGEDLGKLQFFDRERTHVLHILLTPEEVTAFRAQGAFA